MADTPYRLDGRVALVTGAAGGIGLTVARALAAAGAAVAVTDRDGAGAAQAAAGLPVESRAEAHRLDVTDEAEIEAVVGALLERHGRLDIAVNNAGIGARQASETLPAETWRRVLEVNLTGAFLVARAAARPMLARGAGAIINVASIMGLVGGRLYPNPAYHASKGGLVNLTRALALEWAGRGVRVNAVAPTFAETPLTGRLLSEPGLRDQIAAATPLGRLVTPDEVAAAVVFLASDAAAMITGHTLPVDGGWLAQ